MATNPRPGTSTQEDPDDGPPSTYATPNNMSRAGSPAHLEVEETEADIVNNLVKSMRQQNRLMEMMLKGTMKKEEIAREYDKSLHKSIQQLKERASRTNLDSLAEQKIANKQDILDKIDQVKQYDEQVVYATTMPKFEFAKNAKDDPYDAGILPTRHSEIREVLKTIKGKFPDIMTCTTPTLMLNYFMVTVSKNTKLSGLSRAEVHTIIESRFDYELTQIFTRMITSPTKYDEALEKFSITYAMARAGASAYRQYMDVRFDIQIPHESAQSLMKAATLAFPNETLEQIEWRVTQKIELDLPAELQNALQQEVTKHRIKYENMPITVEILVVKIEKLLNGYPMLNVRKPKKHSEVASVQADAQQEPSSQDTRYVHQNARFPVPDEKGRMPTSLSESAEFRNRDNPNYEHRPIGYKKDNNGKKNQQQNANQNQNRNRQKLVFEKIPLDDPRMDEYCDQLGIQYGLPQNGFNPAIMLLNKDVYYNMKIKMVPLDPEQMPDVKYVKGQYRLHSKPLSVPFIQSAPNRKYITKSWLEYFNDKCWRCGLRGCNPASKKCPMKNATPTFHLCGRCRSGLHRTEQCNAFIEKAKE